MDVCDRFVEGMSHAASTVNIVTTDGHRGRAGVTAGLRCIFNPARTTFLLPMSRTSQWPQALAPRPVKEPVTPGRIVMASLVGKSLAESAIAFREHCAAFFADFNSNKAA